MCPHTPHCPPPEELDREAARVVSGHPEQGWSLLCNGLIVFEDTGGLLPDCSIVAPHRAKAGRNLGGATTDVPPQVSREASRSSHAA